LSLPPTPHSADAFTTTTSFRTRRPRLAEGSRAGCGQARRRNRNDLGKTASDMGRTQERVKLLHIRYSRPAEILVFGTTA
jgi:hypothetical protein